MMGTKKALGVAAFAVVLAGGSVSGALLGAPSIASATGAKATTTATTEGAASPAARSHRRHPKARRVIRNEVKVAATAIGVKPAVVVEGLKAGKTLATIAGEHGASAQKVIDALISDANARIDKAVAAGHLKADRAAKLKTNLSERITKFVNEGRPEGHRKGHQRARRVIRNEVKVAATAIGVKPAVVVEGLKAGKTLATIAGEHGATAQKVIDALVTDANAHIDKAVAAGHLKADRAAKLKTNLSERITTFVNEGRPKAHSH
jgi:ribosomal protein S20